MYRECGGHASYVILTTAGRKNPVTFCTGCFALLNMTKKTGPVTEHTVTAKKGRGDKAFAVMPASVPASAVRCKKLAP